MGVFLYNVVVMFNFFDFLLTTLGTGELGIFFNLAKIMSNKGIRKSLNEAAKKVLKEPKHITGFIREMLKDPKSLAKGLSKLTPKELTELNEAIDKAREGTLKVKEEVVDGLTMVEESRALSSTWLIHGLYRGTKKNGFITITTRQGKSYDFNEIPIPYEVWEKMKNTIGRGGNGAGSIFHHEYWDKFRGAKIKEAKLAKIFKLAGLKVRR